MFENYMMNTPHKVAYQAEKPNNNKFLLQKIEK